MSTTIEPAFIDSQWKQAPIPLAHYVVPAAMLAGDLLSLVAWHDGIRLGPRSLKGDAMYCGSPQQIIAMANAAYKDDDVRKLTWAHVDALLEMSLHEQKNGTYPDSSPWDDTTLGLAKALHDVLASYLPPRETG